ncbi:wax ester synthase/diacylglycerol acyltransferase 11-like isoform X1 [Gastrolobium bilobum]|uniref:wax ester synthase/diacylglycerol acyltransferase 11-like isoform X1 n=1 Tax=Gastrolobium bilobum TaxID=150636 RepID=UPI002AB04469|nr:wax ester synthase/diacylglycerol acyltransferase 11-like isoform X1 [Gastrolobium bilobum]
MFNLQVSNIMDNLEEVTEPVSPSGRYFNSSIICAYVFGFLESEVPINDSQTMYLLKHVFLPINPRFSSIMVRDKHGKMMWKKVEVRPEDHIKFPIFPKNESSEFYDQYFDEYVSKIMMERTPQEKPLWEIHMIKYPTSNAAGTLIFKLHHALGDGYSLMGALLSCLQRADDPSLPLSFPSRKSSESPPPYEKGFFKWFPSTIFSFFKSISDFGWSIAKSSMIEDDKTPIRNGDEGVEFQPSVLSNISFSLDHIKQIKSKLGVTINDVITGVIFYGIRLYMQEIDNKARKANSTGLVMLSTRNIGSYQSVQDMTKADSKSPWGNHISFLHVSIPKLSQASLSNPLEFVWKAQKIIKRKRNSFTVFLIEWLLDMELKLRGPEAVAKHMYGTLRNSSVVMSNLIGPVEPMALANHPVKGLYFTMTGGPESINIAVMSYTRVLRVTLKTQKGFIDEQKFKFCMVKAFEDISKAATEVPNKSKG